MTNPHTDAAPSGSPVAVVPAPAAVQSHAVAPRVERDDPLLSAVTAFNEMRSLAKSLVDSGFLPKAINTPEKAIAVMLAGRELGIGPMIALRSIHIIDAKPVVAADLLLARFKADGGRAQFRELTEKRAELWLRLPNGDEHVETFTIEMARDAQLLGKDNWKKHPKAMLRSRVITAGLKSIGYEPTAGVYTPDEAEEFDTSGSLRDSAVANDAPRSTRRPVAGEPVDGTPSGPRCEYKGAKWEGGGATFPYDPYKGIPLNAKYLAGEKRDNRDVGGLYVITNERLLQADKWARERLALLVQKRDNGEDVDEDKLAYFSELTTDIETEGKSRASEASKQS